MGDVIYCPLDMPDLVQEDCTPAIVLFSSRPSVRPQSIEFCEEQGALVPTAWRDSYRPLRKEYTRIALSTQSWLLSHRRVLPGVDAVQGRRLVLLPTGRVNRVRQDELVRRFLEKYRDYAII